MFKPLRELIAEKIAHHGPNRTGFDDLSLVVFYNLAWIYNSPAETPLFTFEDAAARIRQLLSSGLGPFDRVFLFLALVPGRVLRIVRAPKPKTSLKANEIAAPTAPDGTDRALAGTRRRRQVLTGTRLPADR